VAASGVTVWVELEELATVWVELEERRRDDAEHGGEQTRRRCRTGEIRPRVAKVVRASWKTYR
jgi:hypothetical protein